MVIDVNHCQYSPVGGHCEDGGVVIDVNHLDTDSGDSGECWLSEVVTGHHQVDSGATRPELHRLIGVDRT